MVASFKEKLSAAKGVERPSVTVSVCLDPEVAARRSELQAKIDAEKAKPQDDRVGKKSPVVALQEELDGLNAAEVDALVEIRVERAAGMEWGLVVGRYPARPDSPFDLRFGFNINELVASEGRRWAKYREGDDWLPFDYKAKSRDTVEVNEWRDLCAAVSGADFEKLTDAVFELNVWEPFQRRERLGKALALSESASS
jgi:hypothetical protein